jgi:hypothetical protein
VSGSSHGSSCAIRCSFALGVYDALSYETVIRRQLPLGAPA